MSLLDDVQSWLARPGTGPYGPYMDVPGPGNPVIPGQEGLNPNYNPVAAGPSPLDAVAALIQAPINAANAVYDPVAGAATRTLLLLAGIGIILVTVITSGDDD